MLSLTPTAATEMKRLIESEDHKPVLRIRVEAGGCSGLQYSMDFDSAIEDSDEVFDSEGIQLVVDKKSLPHVKGLKVDFSKALIGGGFKFINPNATQSCSCGQSFAT